MNKLRIHERMCIYFSECARKCVCWCQNTCLTYTPTHAWWSKAPFWMHATLSSKMHMHLCLRAYATVQKLLCHGNYSKLLWVLCKHRAGCRLPHALLLSRRNRSSDAERSRKPSKSMLAHDAFAAAVSHKHHSIIRVGAGLIQFVYGSHLKLGHGAHPWQNLQNVLSNSLL